MSSALRPLLTAGAAGALLCALCFVPSAHGRLDGPHPAGDRTPAAARTVTHTPARDTAALAGGGQGGGTADAKASRQLALADADGAEATPYLIGGAGVLGLGAAYVARSSRGRGRRA